MNLGDLKTTLEKNKKPIAIAGAVGVAGLALVKSRGGEKKPAATGSVQSSGGQVARTAGGVYDSSSSDVYNAIQPQLERFGQMLAELQNKGATPPPTPVPAPPPGTTTPTTPKPTTPTTPVGPKPPASVGNDGTKAAAREAATKRYLEAGGSPSNTGFANVYGPKINPFAGSHKADAAGNPIW